MVIERTGKAFGIDIGGTGIKGGVVDLSTGKLIGDRFRKDTPHPATPEAVARTAAEVAGNFDYHGPVRRRLPRCGARTARSRRPPTSIPAGRAPTWSS